MSNAVTDARGELFVALQAKQPGRPWRVHEYEPGTPVSPCVYIGTPELTLNPQAGARFTVASFPVYIVEDGARRAQRAQLDEQLAAVWDAALEVGDPTSARSTTLTVGDATLVGLVVDVEIPLRALTLCPPTLEAV